MSSRLEFILEAADFSENFQAFLENYGKENNIFECAFTLSVFFDKYFENSATFG